jgi:5-methyltetrahydrofolate--homocysteine methyltransferase
MWHEQDCLYPRARLGSFEQEGEFAEQLYVHWLGVQAAEGVAEWLHSEVRRELGIPLDQRRRYSWGYPACPDQSEHEKAHHPQAVSSA